MKKIILLIIMLAFALICVQIQAQEQTEGETSTEDLTKKVIQESLEADAVLEEADQLLEEAEAALHKGEKKPDMVAEALKFCGINLTEIKGKKVQNPARVAYLAALCAYSGWIGYTLGSKAGSCFAEQSLKGTKYCETCNKQYFLCTKERCEVLGSCKWIAKGKQGGGVCIPKACEPTALPVITSMKIHFYIDRTKHWKSFEAPRNCPVAPPDVTEKSSCLTIDEKINASVSDAELAIELNQHAKCRYIIDKANASFDEMQDFDDNQFYPTKQKARIDLSKLELGENHTIYVKCKGGCDQAHPRGFDWNYIRFVFEPKPDELPPRIVKVVPGMDQWISSEATEQTIELWLDENADCFYSHSGTNEVCGNNLTANFSEMCGEGETAFNVLSFECSDNEQCCSAAEAGEEPTCYEKHACTRCRLRFDTSKGFTLLNFSEIQESKDVKERISKEALDLMRKVGMKESKAFRFTFRCKDKAGNEMPLRDVLHYIIMTYPPFSLNITKPFEGLRTYEREIAIEVETSRETTCRYYVNKTEEFEAVEWENMTSFDDGFALKHSTKRYFEPANYTLLVRCRDHGMLEQESRAEFEILNDSIAPRVIRFYKKDEWLFIETDELSDCSYSTENCAFNFSDGIAMTGKLQYLHSTLWADHAFYIKCRDRWHNYPGHRSDARACTAIIMPYEVT